VNKYIFCVRVKRTSYGALSDTQNYRERAFNEVVQWLTKHTETVISSRGVNCHEVMIIKKWSNNINEEKAGNYLSRNECSCVVEADDLNQWHCLVYSEVSVAAAAATAAADDDDDDDNAVSFFQMMQATACSVVRWCDNFFHPYWISQLASPCCM